MTELGSAGVMKWRGVEVRWVAVAESRSHRDVATAGPSTAKPVLRVAQPKPPGDDRTSAESDQ